MINSSVIVSFAVCIIFNIGLNSFDVYSDISLAYKTLAFELGDSLLLSGCKVCHGKEDEDVFSVRNSECQQCLTQSRAFQCGQSFKILNKLNELQQSNQCNAETFEVKWNFKEYSYDFTNNCNSAVIVTVELFDKPLFFAISSKSG